MDLDLPSTSMNLELPSNPGNPELPSTSVDPVILSTSVDPTLPRLVRHVTFHLPLPSEDKCQEVGVVKESLSWDLEQKRQEVLQFYGGGVVVIPTNNGGVMYIED